MEQQKQLSITDQVGSLLPQVQSMACFTSFVAFKVNKLDDAHKSAFERISDDLSSIFFRLSDLYTCMAEQERKSIQDIREEVSKK